MKKTLLALSLFSLIPYAQAGGYRVAIQGQKALGMGHTGVAVTQSAESVFFNPGAITELDGHINIDAGFTAIVSENLYQNEDTGSSADADNPLGTPVNFYFTKKLNDRYAYGFGLYTPFGSAVDWENDWVGSHLIENIELRSIFLQPTLAYKINKSVSVGFGPIIAISSVDLERNLSTSLQDANGNRSSVSLEDSGIVDYGYTLGALFHVNPHLDIGVSYRGEINVKADGDAEFDNIPDALQTTFVDGGFEAELPLPAELTLGLAYKISDKTLLAFDYNYTFWDTYEELVFDFDSVNSATANPSVNPRNYKNASTYRIGINHQKTNKWQLRAGMYYDQTPIRDGYFAPETPRTDSLGFTAGASYSLNNKLSFDFSGLYLHFDEEDNSYDFNAEGVLEGTYKVNVWSLGFGISYKL